MPVHKMIHTYSTIYIEYRLCLLYSIPDHITFVKVDTEKTKSFVTRDTDIKKWLNAIKKYNDHGNCQYHK